MYRFLCFFLILSQGIVYAQEDFLSPEALAQAPDFNIKSAFTNPEQVYKLRISEDDYNPTTTLPSSIGDLENLQMVSILDFPDFNFKQALIILGRLPKLQVLVLRGNKLKDLPPEISQLKSLKVLDLSFNQFSKLPPKVTEIESLEELQLGGNQLNSLPSSLTQLKNLKKLSLGETYLENLKVDMGNKFTSLPPEIKTMTQIEEIYLAENTGLNIDNTLTDLENLPQLKVLDFSKNLIKELPRKIGELKHLEKLNLNYNQLTAIPHELGKLSELKELSLDGNLIEFVPPEIGKLKNLEVLSFAGDPYSGFNQLRTLPYEIGLLQNLQKLNLMGNKLISVPTQIGLLENLVELNLAGYKRGGYKQQNIFRRLPTEISQLKNLKVLDLSCSALSSSEIANVQSLLPQTEVLNYKCK